ncbi:hypothetical protein DTO021C3_6499 [Paecilomyces variotii]|nr:hypothetical protein DTO021C3_6499 [Paecilomyces variotii]
MAAASGGDPAAINGIFLSSSIHQSLAGANQQQASQCCLPARLDCLLSQALVVQAVCQAFGSVSVGDQSASNDRLFCRSSLMPSFATVHYQSRPLPS